MSVSSVPICEVIKEPSFSRQANLVAREFEECVSDNNPLNLLMVIAHPDAKRLLQNEKF